MKINLTIYFAIFCINIFAQSNEKRISYHGNIETGGMYNGLVSIYAPYPQTYWYFSTNQNINIMEVPFDVKVRFTNLSAGIFTQRLYPNVIQVGYNVEKFRQNLYKKFIQKLEKEYEQHLIQLSKKKEADVLLHTIDSITTQTESISDLENRKKQILNTPSYTDSSNILQEINEKLNFLYKIQKLKEDINKEQKNNVPNDSMLQMYNFYRKKTDIIITELCRLNKVRSFEKIMSNIQSFNIGRYFWISENPLVSNGITIDGGEFNLRIKKITVGGIGGKTYPIIFWNQYSGWMSNFSQNVYGGHAGFQSNIHSVKFSTYYFYGNNNWKVSRENIVSSLEYYFNTPKIQFTFNLAGAQTHLNSSFNQYFYQGLPVIENFSADNIIANIFQQRKLIGLQTGYALNSEMKLNFSAPLRNIILKYEYVSPFYHSAAAPFIMRDQQFISLVHSFVLNKHFSSDIGVSYREDNLSKLKTTTTVWKTVFIRPRWRIHPQAHIIAFYKLIERNSNHYVLQHQIHGAFNYFSMHHFLKSFSLYTYWFNSKGIPSVLNNGLHFQINLFKNIAMNHTLNYLHLSSDTLALKHSFSYQLSLEILSNKTSVSLNGFFYNKERTYWNKGIDANTVIKWTKTFWTSTSIGYGQNRSVTQELGAWGNLNPYSFFNTSYWYGNFQMTFQW